LSCEFQVPLNGSITLILETQYDLTSENTSLNYEVRSKADTNVDESMFFTITVGSVPTQRPPEGLETDNVTIIIACMAGLITIALIIAGIFCWKRKRRRTLIKKKGKQLHNKYSNDICQL